MRHGVEFHKEYQYTSIYAVCLIVQTPENMCSVSTGGVKQVFWNVRVVKFLYMTESQY